MKNILITGAGGFVGRNLVEHFAGQHMVYSMRHNDLDLLDADAVQNFFARHPVDVVLHCAAVGGNRLTNYDTNRMDVVETNLRMFLNLQRSLPLQARLIHFGSGAEYSRPHCFRKMPETYFDAHVPVDAYGFAKYAISRFIESQDRVTCLRIFGLYGQYEEYRYKFISNAILKNLLKLPIVINQNAVFDYLFIEDFVHLVEKLVEQNPIQKHYNITPVQSIELLSIARIINQISDFQSEITVLNEGMNIEYTGDNSRLVTELGGHSFTSYAEGIARLHRYYQSVLGTLDTDTIRQDPYLQYCRPRTPSS